MKNIIPAILSIFLLFSCSNPGTRNDSSSSSGTAMPPTSKQVISNLDDTATGKLVSLLANYYALKNALVATNATGSTSAAQTLEHSARNLQGYLLAKDSLPGPLRPYLDTIIMGTRDIAAMEDNTCEKQRLAFSFISTSLYSVVKLSNIKNISIYHTFCPMAFNEKGATWLSEMNEIKNPYFGQKMLECGEITDSLK